MNKLKVNVKFFLLTLIRIMGCLGQASTLTYSNRGNMKQAEFDKLMEKYEETHESSLLNFARDLYMVVTFLCVAYLVFTVLI